MQLRKNSIELEQPELYSTPSNTIADKEIEF